MAMPFFLIKNPQLHTIANFFQVPGLQPATRLKQEVGAAVYYKIAHADAAPATVDK